MQEDEAQANKLWKGPAECLDSDMQPERSSGIRGDSGSNTFINLHVPVHKAAISDDPPTIAETFGDSSACISGDSDVRGSLAYNAFSTEWSAAEPRYRRVGEDGEWQREADQGDVGPPSLQGEAAGPGAYQGFVPTGGAHAKDRSWCCEAGEGSQGLDGRGANDSEVLHPARQSPRRAICDNDVEDECDNNGRELRCDLWVQGLSCMDEEAPSCGNLRLFHLHGPEWNTSPAGAVRGGAREASERDALWKPCEGFHSGTAAATGERAEEEETRGFRDRGNCCGGVAEQAQLASFLGAVGRVPPRLGEMEDRRQGCARGSHRDMGTLPGGAQHGCSTTLESGESDGRNGDDRGGGDMMVRSPLLRICPGCRHVLTFNSGNSCYVLKCDGDEHVGPRELGGNGRFSCLKCGRYDFCVTCAEALSPPSSARQVTLKWRTIDDAGASEYNSFTICGTASSSRSRVSKKHRDKIHCNCVPREHFALVQRDLHEVRRQMETMQRRSSSICMSAVDDCKSAERVARRIKSRQDYNYRKVEALKKESHAAMEEMAAAKAESAGLRDRLQTLQAELNDMRREARTARSDAEVAAHQQERDRAEKNRLHEQRDIAEAKLRSSRDALKKSQADLEKLSARASEAEAKLAEAQESSQAESAGLRGRLKTLQLELNDARREARASRSDAEVADHEREREVAEKSRLREQRDIAEAKLRSSRDALKKTQAEHKEATARAAGADLCVEQLTRQVHLLERMLREAVQGMGLAHAIQTSLLSQEVSALERAIHGGRGVGVGLLERARRGREITEQLQLDRQRIPSAEVSNNSAFYRSVAFVRAAVHERALPTVALALQKEGFIEGLMKTAEFQPFVKRVIIEVLGVIQQHWTARHSVVLQAEVHTSRSEYDTLRHLLSFIYDHQADSYRRLVVWKNPFKESDFLLAPCIASRYSYLKERTLLYGECFAESSADGLFVGLRDLESRMVHQIEHYWDALDPAVKSGKKELMLVISGDATGGWRGSSVTHGEVCIGSWAAGRGQSKLAALPVWLMEGEDSAENLRSRVQPVADQWNSIKKKGFLLVKVEGAPRQVPVKLLCAADFQFFKAAMNMSKYTSAVWCCCPSEKLYMVPDTPAQNWEDVLTFYDSIGCELKSLETICELNHYSYEVMQGRQFRPFKCRCGYSSGSEREWREAVEAHMQLDEVDRKAADLEHSSNPTHCRHKPFAPPLFHHGTMDHSADVLHLVFINLFTSFLELTMLVYVKEFSATARQPFEDYLRSISVPMKIVKAEGVADMKQSLCGRDAKVLLNNTIDHLVHLLEFVSLSDAEVCEAVTEEEDARGQADPQKRKRTAPVRDGDDDFDWEDPNEDERLEQPEGDEEDEDHFTRVQRDAQSWDKFLELVHAMRPFERDDEDYRKARGVETFNAAAGVVKEYKRLNPSSKSACPHVALCVLPRQQVEHGDHHRRGTDHGEALGASIKDQLHRRTLRRRAGSQVKEHKRRDADGHVTKVWKQGPLKESRVLQVFRSMSVNEMVVRDEGSHQFLQRKHFDLSRKGFTTAAGSVSKCIDTAAEPNGIGNHFLQKEAMHFA